MDSPHVLVLYNQPVLPKDHPDAASESDILYSVEVVRTSLKNRGITNSQFGMTRDIAGLLAHLDTTRPDVIFNLFEGPADNSVEEVYLAGLLEWLGYPFTGCPASALTISRNKTLTKHLLLGAGLNTPPFLVVYPGEEIPVYKAGWPAMVKPAEEDASVGIDQASVVQNQEQLEARVQFVRDNYGGAVLIERFIVGRELHVSVVDLHGTGTLVPLPLGEIEFVAPGSERIWPIYSYTAKWDESSTEFKYTNIRIGNHVPEELLARLHKVADAAFRIIGCRDYARIDTRVTADGEIYVLEVNPNPSIYSILIDSGLPAVGADYDTFIHALVRNALTRGADARNTGDRRVRKPG